jgi:hypothetical protein
MRGSLGEKIGEGVFSDVHAWAPGQVLKLFKSGIPRWFGEHEARMTRAVFTAGGPAPNVLDEVNLEGRFGIVLPRLDGPTLRQLLRTRGITHERAAAILATLYLSVHKTPPPPAVLALRNWFGDVSRLFDGMIPTHIAAGVLTLIERLRPGDGLCHFDLHPGNVIMTRDGPRIIDWTGAVRAPAALDLGRFQVLLIELRSEGTDPERPRALNAAVQSEYARLAGMSPAALTAAMDLYLPIARTSLLLGPMPTPLREWLIQRIEAALRSEDLI